MSDRRPERVYGVLVRDDRVFVLRTTHGTALPGGTFPDLADDRKAELRAHLLDQLGVVSRATWAQGAFDYQPPGDPRASFSGFYSVWEWDGEVPEDAGYWLTVADVGASGLPAPIKILLTSVLETKAMRTT